MDIEFAQLIGRAIGLKTIFFTECVIEPMMQKLTEVVWIIAAKDTCSPDFFAEWSDDNPLIGHSDITALLAHDCFGGTINCDSNHNYFWLQTGGNLPFHTFAALKSGSLIVSHETKTAEEMILEDKNDVAKRHNIFKKRAIELLNRK